MWSRSCCHAWCQTDTRCDSNSCSCASNNNSSSNCLEEVYITISDKEFGDYVAKVVSLDEFIDMSNPSGFSGDDLVIAIETVELNDKGDNKGDKLQTCLLYTSDAADE